MSRKEILLDNKNNFTLGEAAEIFKVYQQNPTLAAQDLLQLEDGLPWHQRLALKVAWNSPNTIMIWTRGGGKTWFNAMYALLRAMCYPNEKVGIFSASFRQAKFVWAEIEKMYSNSAIVKECCYKRPMSPPDKCYLQLKNGSVIEALPLGDGQKIRGARYFDIVTDEVAQIPEDIFDIVIRGMTATSKDPMAEVKKLKAQQELLKLGLITEEQLYTPTANKILMTSTAFYRFNHLWKRVELFDNEIRKPENANLNPNIVVDNGPDGTKVMWNKERALIMFDYMDPPKGFMKESSIKEARLKMSENKFKMEYCAYFPPDSEGFFRRSKVEKARNHDLFTIEQHGEPGSNYVLGIDVARKSDNFAITVAKIAGEKLHVVNVITLNNKSFNDMHDLIRRVIRTYNVVHICMDTGGGGTTLQDMLEDERLLADGDKLIYDSINDDDKLGREGLHILDMVKFSDDSIPQMGFQMASDLDHGRLLLPCIPNRKHRLTDELPENEAERISLVLRRDEEAYQEIEHLIDETTSIIATSTRTGRMHLGLPSEVVGADSKKDFEDGMRAPRKDRWTSCMLAVWAWHRCTNLEKYEQVSEPAYGFSLRK